ncbi:MAG TPA: hypothetical protein VNG33_08615 [Polyangiaceae bacterium]|nr:hypothetical protein [Polyangiaceae bacterium]
MRNKLIWSVLSLVALATGGLAVGCDGDTKIAKSAEGDSCTKTSDCNDGLRCERGTCYSSTVTVPIDNGFGGDGSSGGAPVVVPPKPPVLGGPGESCTKRADCEDGLSCLSQRCTMDGAGAGGAGTGTGPVLGGLGETCVLTSDCSTGFACMPGGVRGEGIGVGVCTPIDSGLKPTGNVCGAECAVAADCCELPVLAQATTGASSCADLAMLVGNIANCATAIGVNGSICLAYASYCDDQCSKGTWSCDGQCHYAAKCTKAAEVVGGCPPYTRGGHSIPACDVKSGKCQGGSAGVGCISDASCDAGLPVADHALADVCSVGECACNIASGGCYRKCNEPTDCVAGYTCDDKTSLCVPVSGCATDEQCITAAGDYRVKCVKGVCTQPPCEHDIDCSPNGLVNGALRSVCGPDKTCTVLGCASNDECGPYIRSGEGGGVRAFCGPPITIPATAGPVSAITD